MKKLEIYLAYLLLGLIIGFNLWLNFPETKILADPNDNIFQYSLVYRTNWVWENFRCPLSLSCLPNLTDHVVTAWAEGYPLPFYYSHIPQIAIVSSYHMIIKPLISLLHYPFSLYQYYNWTKYLLLTLFPLPVFLALRLVGFSLPVSVLGAFFASHFSTDGLYGIDPPSYLWRGYGLTSQLYALIFLPLGLAFTYKAMAEDGRWKMEDGTRRLKLEDRKKVKNLSSIIYHPKLSSIFYPLSSNKNLFLAALFLTLTTAGHLGIGIIGLISTLPFLFFDLKPRHIIQRAKKLFIVYCLLFIALAYWLIPLLLNNNYHIISFWDPIWKFNSYGWYEVVRQFIQGEIFDWHRAPIITALVIIGFFALLTNGRLFIFSLLFALWFLLYFGRTTWGGLIDLIPGMKDFHQHRFIVGIHIAALFLIPAGLTYLFNLIKTTISYILKIFTFTKKWEIYQTITFYIISLTFISILIYNTAKQTYNYAQLNNRWIVEANIAYRYDEKNFQDLTAYLNRLPRARIYAGRPGNWGKQFRLGSTQMYMLFGVHGFDMSQFLPETWSPLSENEQNFDERVSEDYDLLNIRYIISSKNEGFTDAAKMVKQFGPFQLYQVPTSGWFDVVTSPMLVKTNKTNYINLVHLWHRSYPRRWKMYPLISVEKNPQIPFPMQKIIEMTDEVSYIDSDKSTIKNIFSDYPFLFPEATISAKIVSEKIHKQTYSAEVEVPQNCKQCMIMFKASYHPDWQVKVDGKEAPKFAVFPFYLATTAPPGVHQVEFTYQPNKLKVILLYAEIIVVIGFLFRKKLLPLATKFLQNNSPL